MRIQITHDVRKVGYTQIAFGPDRLTDPVTHIGVGQLFEFQPRVAADANEILMLHVLPADVVALMDRLWEAGIRPSTQVMGAVQ